MGKSHSPTTSPNYLARIDAVNFALDNDDGARTRHYNDADIILIGVSRAAKPRRLCTWPCSSVLKRRTIRLPKKTWQNWKLPAALQPYRHKLFGLTIDPERLAAIRTERRANSRYASLKQCYHEVDEVEEMYQRENIPFLSTTNKSIEEISTRIMAETGLQRRLQS